MFNNKLDDYIEALKTRNITLKDVPEEERSIEVYRAAIIGNPFSIWSVPDEILKTDMEIWLLAIEKNGLIIAAANKKKIILNSKIYFAAVKKNSRAIQFVPEEMLSKEILNEAFKLALQEDNEVFDPTSSQALIEYLTKYPMMCNLFPNPLPQQIYNQVYLELIKINLSIEKRKIDEIPLSIRMHVDQETHLKAITLCHEAVKENYKTAKLLPKNYLTKEIMYSILEKINNHDALKFILSLVETEKKILELSHIMGIEKILVAISNLYDEEFIMLFAKLHSLSNDEIFKNKIYHRLKLIMKKDPLVFEEIINSDNNNEVALSIVNCIELEDIHQDVFLKLFNKLKSLSVETSFQNKINQRLQSILAMNPMLLEDIIDIVKDKKMILGFVCNIKIENIISENFKLYPVLKSLSDDKNFQNHLKYKLSEINHVVVTKDKGFGDKENRDGYYVYKEKRPGKFIHVDVEDLDEFMSCWNKENEIMNSKHNIELILMDHTNQKSIDIANMDVNDIADFINKQPEINSVILMGCQTVNAARLEKENKMVEKYLESLEEAYIFQLVPKEMSLSSTEVIRQLKNTRCQNIYALKQTDQDNQFELLYLQKKSKYETIIQLYSLNLEQVNQIIVESQSKKMDFPDKNTGIISYIVHKPRKSNPQKKNSKKTDSQSEKTQKNNNPLTHKMIDCILNPRLFKKYIKKIYPFETSIELNVNETAKLKDSLFKKLWVALKDKVKDKSREIKIKGYRAGLHVDTKEKKFYSSDIYFYKNYQELGFYAKTDNIDREKFKQDQKSKRKKLHRDYKETLAKSIKTKL